MVRARVAAKTSKTRVIVESPVRVRRSPDEARALILAAAARVFERKTPDAAGLRDVAEEAQVSHALVTHYFGTYEALVDAVLTAKASSVRDLVAARLATLGEISLRDLLRVAAHALESTGASRMLSWALVTGRAQHRDFGPARAKGLLILVNAMEERVARTGLVVSREDLEFVLMAAISMLQGYTLARPTFYRALGRTAPAPSDDLFIERAADMIEAYLHRGGGAAL
jgi:TetR/AcrR family transcriptional regulator, repressor for neighboring sulfatase